MKILRCSEVRYKTQGSNQSATELSDNYFQNCATFLQEYFEPNSQYDDGLSE